MGTITAEELRIRVAISNPNMSSDEVRREADRVMATLDGITAQDNLRAAIEAQTADEATQRAAEAQRRAEAFNDAANIVRESHPGWDDASVKMEASRLAAENDAAIAALDLRASLADGFDNHTALPALGRR